MAQDFFVTVEVDQTAYVNVETQKVAEVAAIGIQGLPGVRGPDGKPGPIEDITNVDAIGAEDGSILVLDTTAQMWKATRILEKQIVDGGIF